MGLRPGLARVPPVGGADPPGALRGGGLLPVPRRPDHGEGGGEAHLRAVADRARRLLRLPRDRRLRGTGRTRPVAGSGQGQADPGLGVPLDRGSQGVPRHRVDALLLRPAQQQHAGDDRAHRAGNPRHGQLSVGPRRRLRDGAGAGRRRGGAWRGAGRIGRLHGLPPAPRQPGTGCRPRHAAAPVRPQLLRHRLQDHGALDLQLAARSGELPRRDAHAQHAPDRAGSGRRHRLLGHLPQRRVPAAARRERGAGRRDRDRLPGQDRAAQRGPRSGGRHGLGRKAQLCRRAADPPVRLLRVPRDPGLRSGQADRHRADGHRPQAAAPVRLRLPAHRAFPIRVVDAEDAGPALLRRAQGAPARSVAAHAQLRLHRSAGGGGGHRAGRVRGAG